MSARLFLLPLTILFTSIPAALALFAAYQPPKNKAIPLAGQVTDIPIQKSGEDSVQYFNGLQFAIVGKLHSEENYHRLPQPYQQTVRKEVWDLSLCSAGMGIRFRTNASQISVRWTVLKDAVLPHMAATGVKGVDLYANVGGHWQFVNTGFPRKKTNESVLLANGTGTYREYWLNLPLYDGVDSLEIGVNTGAVITKPTQNLPTKKPIVYYGTSIAQGACATRPGMAFTNILARQLNQGIINLGFSGNGKMETAVGQAMLETDAALFVIDCNPNTPANLIYERIVPLVQLLKKEKPNVPVLLVEGFAQEQAYFAKTGQTEVEKQRAELKRGYETLRKSGITQLYYQKGENLIGQDHEGTVDGVHPTDVGMERMAQQLLPVIKTILSIER